MLPNSQEIIHGHAKLGREKNKYELMSTGLSKENLTTVASPAQGPQPELQEARGGGTAQTGTNNAGTHAPSPC